MIVKEGVMSIRKLHIQEINQDFRLTVVMPQIT